MYLECTDDVDIAGRSSAMGVKQGCMGKTSYFRTKCANISETVAGTCQVTLNHKKVALCFRLASIGLRWPWMTLNCWVRIFGEFSGILQMQQLLNEW